MKTTWKGNREYLLAQVIRLVEKYIESDKLRIEPAAVQSGLSAPTNHNHASHEQRGGTSQAGDSF